MEFHVTFSLSNGKEVVQTFNNFKDVDELSTFIEQQILIKNGFHKASPGYYGNFFGVTFIKVSEIVSYHISKS